MRKGKYGIAYAVYAVAALVAAMLGWIEVTVIITLFAIALEQDEWTSRQTLAASATAFLAGIIKKCEYGFNRPMSWISSFAKGDFYKVDSIYRGVFEIISDLLLLTLFIFLVIAIFNVAKGKEAGIPIVSKFVNWAFGKVTASAPVASAPVASAQAATEPAKATKMCPKCNIPVEGNFCEKCGTKA